VAQWNATFLSNSSPSAGFCCPTAPWELNCPKPGSKQAIRLSFGTSPDRKRSSRFIGVTAMSDATFSGEGVDFLWIETMSSLDEVRHAFEGTRSACDLPIVVTMSFVAAGRTMTGVTGTAAALIALGVAGLGANCGKHPRPRRVRHRRDALGGFRCSASLEAQCRYPKAGRDQPDLQRHSRSDGSPCLMGPEPRALLHRDRFGQCKRSPVMILVPRRCRVTS
jgi:hypothetical protein